MQCIIQDINETAKAHGSMLKLGMKDKLYCDEWGFWFETKKNFKAQKLSLHC